MEHSEFTNMMFKLADTFGQVQGGGFERRVSRYYMRFKDYNSFIIKKAFVRIEENEDRFPTLKRMIDYVQTELANKPAHQKEPTQCKLCNSTGIIRAVDNDGYRPIFKCSECDNCQYNYPVWNEMLCMEGYTRIVESGWDQEDEMQIKGLASLICDEKDMLSVMRKNIIWLKAPESMCKKAWELYKSGWRSKNNLFGKQHTLKNEGETPPEAKEANRRKTLSAFREQFGDEIRR